MRAYESMPCVEIMYHILVYHSITEPPLSLYPSKRIP